MPTVEDYEPLAPFTLDELVSAANSVLRDRPNLKIQGRTVRYYISNGLLPPPSGGPKFARYGIEHLRKIVGIRMGLDAGLKLEEAAQFHQSPAMLMAVCSPEAIDWTIPAPPSGALVRKLRLTSRSVLEIEGEEELLPELKMVAAAIVSLINQEAGN